MKLSIVTSLYKSEKYIAEFYLRITKTAKQISSDYEIIFVNDGSPDKSLTLASDLLINDEKVVIIDLSRNFGHHKALMTGLMHAKGDYIFLIDSDLEENPEYLLDFWNEYITLKNVDVLYGVQEKRRGNILERYAGEIFYVLFNKLSSVEIPRNLVTCRLMNRIYVDSLLQFRESEIFLAGLWSATGFVQIPKMIKKHSHSRTTYNIRKKISIVVNSITAFSAVPLRLVFVTGTTITLGALFYISYLIVLKLLFNAGVDGWTSVMASIWMLGGMIIFAIGIIGEYLSKIFIETKKRPYTIIKTIFKNEK